MKVAFLRATGFALAFLGGVPQLAARPRAEPVASSHQELAVRVLVERFVGQNGKAARAAVLAALEKENSVDVVAVRALEAKRDALDGSAQSYAKAGRELGVDAFIAGKLTRSKRGFTLRVSVISGRDGSVRGQVQFEARDLRRLATTLMRELFTRVAELLRSTPAEQEEAESETEAAPESESVQTDADLDELVTELPLPEQETRSAKPAARRDDCELVRLEASAGVFSRALAFEHEQPGPLRGQRLAPVPTAGLAVRYYPLQHTSCSAWSGLNLEGSYEQVLYAVSRIAERPLRTTIADASFGFGYRVSSAKLFVEPSLKYELRWLEIAGGYVPNFGYRTLRGGLAAGAELTPVFIEAFAAYHWVEHAGELTDAAWFPLARGSGYELGGRLGVRFSQHWSSFVGARWHKMHFDLNPNEPYGYPHGSAQALDDVFLTTLLGLRWAP